VNVDPLAADAVALRIALGYTGAGVPEIMIGIDPDDSVPTIWDESGDGKLGYDVKPWDEVYVNSIYVGNAVESLQYNMTGALRALDISGTFPTATLIVGQDFQTITLAAMSGGSVGFGAVFLEGAEIAAPSAPAANGGRLFFQDNGSGKTQLAVIFSSGAVQVIATQP